MELIQKDKDLRPKILDNGSTLMEFNAVSNLVLDNNGNVVKWCDARKGKVYMWWQRTKFNWFGWITKTKY